MDEKIIAFHSHLKANDFAHLNNTIEALTFTLEKNKFLEKEDKKIPTGGCRDFKFAVYLHATGRMRYATGRMEVDGV